MTCAWRVCFLLSAVCCASWSHAAERYVAMFADGERREDAEIREWCEPAVQPKIGGRNLFDPPAAIRWIIDRSVLPAPKPARYIEFAGGDRIAGEVVSSADGLGNPYEFQPQHLILRPAFDFLPPEVNSVSDLRVATEWVQRIVWEHTGSDDHRPGTVWMRSGTSLTFRSHRWTASGVAILTSEGLKEVPFADLGEIHLPGANSWTTYYEQLAILSPTVRSQLIQIETNDGNRVTTSVERFQPRHHGDRIRPEQWYQLAQPAWSLDPIWFRYRTIRSWKFFAPNEIPLSQFALIQARQQAVFGSGWDWQTDQNVRRGLLQSLDQEFGWGFGVFGTSELMFEYPEIATEFRVGYGLDRAAGQGGCVNAEIVDGTGQTLTKHTNLIGSKFVGRVNWVGLPRGTSEQRRLTLRTEMAHESRPATSDPFDVRDFFNWYEPEVRLDQAALEAEVVSRAARRHGGLIGWTISSRDQYSIRAHNEPELYDGRDPQFRRVVRSVDRYYTLSRKVQFGPRDRWLTLVASRFAENSSPTLLQIRIEGRVFGEFELPIRNSMMDPEPMLVPVSQFQGRTALVEVVVYPKDEKSWVDWRGFNVGADRPGLRTIFEDDVKFVSELQQGAGRVELDAVGPYSGSRSLKVSTGAGVNPRIPGLDALICETPRLGQYRFLVFAWKKTTGSRIQIQLANQGLMDEAVEFAQGDRLAVFHQQGLRRSQNLDERGQRFRYCYEKGVATTKVPMPLWLNGDLPKEWQLVHRDLFGDFGIFSLTGIALKCVDGEAAWFDHLYLARSHEDLQYASTYLVNPQPELAKPNDAGHLAVWRREDFPAEISRIAPLFSSLDAPHGLTRQTEQNGQTDVLRTHANDKDKPLVLRAGVDLPKDHPMLLDLHVSHAQNCDWRLVVKANGDVLTSQLINAELTIAQRGWATIQVDLGSYAGQKVLLEVLNESNDWQNETAYWKRISLIEKE